jgi:hypothetical protein
LPIQVPVDELILIPSSAKELNQFLLETKGKVLRTDVLPEAANERQPSAHLVRVDPASAKLEHLSQMRALFTDEKPLFGSKSDVLRIYALALHFKMEGYAVGVNPRLGFAGLPAGNPVERDNITRTMGLELPILNVPQVLTFMALWDTDEQQIPVAFLDMGFAPNFDFRTPPGGIVECDLEGSSIVDGLLSGFRCGPGVAVGPPTVGASFFGDPVWHGNGVVTIAGGVVNNG